MKIENVKLEHQSTETNLGQHNELLNNKLYDVNFDTYNMHNIKIDENGFNCFVPRLKIPIKYPLLKSNDEPNVVSI